MKVFSIILLHLVIFSSAFSIIDLSQDSIIGEINNDRLAALGGRIDHLHWVTPDTLVFATQKKLTVYDLKDGRELWSHDFTDLEEISTSRDEIYVLSDYTIYQFNAFTGRLKRMITSSEIADIIEKPYILPTSITYLEKEDLLAIISFSEKPERNSYIIDSKNLKLVSSFESDGMTIISSARFAEPYITTLSMRNNIRVWDYSRGKETLRLGENKESAIDATFYSNALFSGASTLVYTIDNSWGTGPVFVYDTDNRKVTTKFDSKNGHIEMDVDFKNSRIAISGTSTDLTIYDFSGNSLATVSGAAELRVMCVAFSPEANKVAIGSWDNTVRVFTIHEK